MEPTLEDHIQRVTDAVRAREEEASRPAANQRNSSDQIEPLRTMLLDLEKEREELMLRLAKIEDQVKDTKIKITEIEEKVAKERQEKRKDLKIFNQKIKEEIEKAVQAGKEDDYALIVCGSKIREYDLKFKKEANAENKFEVEKMEQKALIEVAFGIDPEAERTIKKKFEGSVVEYREDVVEDKPDWSKLIKTSNGKEISIECKENQISALPSKKEQIYKPIESKFEVSGKRQLLVDEKDEYFQVILKKGDEFLDDTKVNIDTNVKIYRSESEKDVFYFFGDKEKCSFSCN